MTSLKKRKQIIISGVIGNILENYDYILYANFAVIISKIFFPQAELYNALLANFTIFATGFLMRPLGAIIFGHIGDKYGRRLALSWSIMLMSIPTSLIGILPSYEEIGIFAPIFLIIIRLMQGVSMGGETSSFMTYLMESTPIEKRNFFIGSIALSSAAIGLFFGFLSAFIYNFYFDEVKWAWRVPFLISFPIGLIGLYVRNKLDETIDFKLIKKQGLLVSFPLKTLFKNYKKRFFVISGLFISISIPFYIFFGFLTTFLVKILGYSNLEVSIIYLICTIIFAIFSIFSGLLSDRFGNHKIMLVSIALFSIFIFPIFQLILSKIFFVTLIGCVLFISTIAIYQGSIPALVVKIFPTEIRAIGTAFSFNLVSAIFGGLSPLFITWLIKTTNSYNIISLYLIASCIISIFTILYAKKLRIF